MSAKILQFPQLPERYDPETQELIEVGSSIRIDPDVLKQAQKDWYEQLLRVE